MTDIRIYVEGGGDSKELKVRCREGFSKLIERSGFKDRLPRITACGGRNATFADFKTACANATNRSQVFMLVDSEDPLHDISKPWDHLKARDGWDRPMGVTDHQALLMATCMETWIVADRAAIRKAYRSDCLQETSLPSEVALEAKHRDTVQDCLVKATEKCKNGYAKGRRSFALLEDLDPETLKALPSFARMVHILDTELPR